MSVEDRIVKALRDLAWKDPGDGTFGYYGWRPLDINWPSGKYLRFAQRRFGDKQKRVWEPVAKVLRETSQAERLLSDYEWIREWRES